ncbi:MAG TPA: hypothetical protein VGE34_00975 [Candidatus Saccharimonadales bacterium]
MTLKDHFPELYDNNLWNEQDDEAYERFNHDFTPEKFQDAVDGAITTREVGGRNFRVFVDTPVEHNGSSIAIPGEYANGTKEAGFDRPSGAFRRGLAIRAIVDPAARLIVLPNDTLFENNLNLSKDERRVIGKGGLTLPLVDRLRIAIEDTDRVTMVGFSQGAVVANDYAAVGAPLDALAIVEAPNVVERSKLSLALEFPKSGGHLHDNFAVSGLAPQTAKERSHGERAYGLDILTRSNIALLNPMRRNSMSDGIASALDAHAGVVHTWAADTDVSPADVNKRIAKKFQDDELYQSYEFAGDFADHSITNVYPLGAAVTRRAIQLGDTSISD